MLGAECLCFPGCSVMLMSRVLQVEIKQGQNPTNTNRFTLRVDIDAGCSLRLVVRLLFCG